jgi:protease-4
MKKIAQWIQYLFAFFGLMVVGMIALAVAGLWSVTKSPLEKLREPSILHLELKGVITGEEEFLDHLREYRDDDNIKGILVSIDSPGGVVGPSQEIYTELKRVREQLKKPVVVTCNALAASGAYYAAVAADKIIVNPGTLMGSIGVIMQFANMERLYDWAKMDFFTITTGKFKDSGSPYRPMRDDEKALFQDMINEVQAQFKTAVKEGRKLRPDVLEQYTDGRIFHGQFAVENGFADELGTFDDAKRIIGEMAGLGPDPEIYQPQDTPETLMEWLNQNARATTAGEKLMQQLLPTQLAGKPLYLMPGVLGQ